MISSFLFSSFCGFPGFPVRFCGQVWVGAVLPVGQVCSTCVSTRTRRISFPTHLIERVNFPSESTMSGKNTALQFLVAGLLLTINGAAGQPMCESCDECSGCKCGENHFYCSICVENSQFGTGYHCEPAPTPRPTLYQQRARALNQIQQKERPVLGRTFRHMWFSLSLSQALSCLPSCPRA